MARKDALIIIPEGWEEWIAGEIIEIQLLNAEKETLIQGLSSL
jgi:hypothetical protein